MSSFTSTYSQIRHSIATARDNKRVLSTRLNRNRVKGGVVVYPTADPRSSEFRGKLWKGIYITVGNNVFESARWFYVFELVRFKCFSITSPLKPAKLASNWKPFENSIRIVLLYRLRPIVCTRISWYGRLQTATSSRSPPIPPVGLESSNTHMVNNYHILNTWYDFYRNSNP